MPNVKGTCPRCHGKAKKSVVVTDVDARLAEFYSGNLCEYLCGNCGLTWQETC